MPEIMGDMDLAFPNLGIYLRDVPKTIEIGGFSIAWYGVILAFGMLMGIIVAAYMAKRGGQEPEHYWDVSIYLMIFGIIGARIYYVLFFWDSYRNNLKEIFNLRGGGLAIYGGVLGGMAALLVFCRIRKLNALTMLDNVMYGLLTGQIIGRWGNFVNREVFGGYTDSLLAMRIPTVMVRAMDIDDSIRSHMVFGTNYIQVHPTFLYESLWNLALLILLILYRKRKRFEGEILLLYFIGYGVGRAWIEAIRTDQLYLPGTKVPVSMVLGLAMAAVSGVLLVLQRLKLKRLPAASSKEEETSEAKKEKKK